MIKTTNMILDELSHFSQANHKIQRMVRDGEIFPIKRGIYVTDQNTSPFLLANAIHNPSYISFNTALSYYGLIPERVVSITSATYKLNRTRMFNNRFGRFTFRDVPANAYFMGIKQIEDGENIFNIATMEKAICDTLYLQKPVKNILELEYLLFEDLRMNRNIFKNIKPRDINQLSKNYRCRNIYLLNQYLKNGNYANNN